MAVLVENQVKRWTYDDYCRLDDGERHEVIDGRLLMAPAPDTWHQNWVGELFTIIRRHVKKHHLGQTFVAPVDVVLDATNVVQPDLVFVAAANGRLVERRGIMGAPDLHVEIISPASVQTDRYEKKALYAKFGVKEYWIGDPANQSIEVLVLKNGAHELFCAASGKGRVRSQLLAGLEFDLAEIV
ncbi:MAG: Uma2 family endonuclease [Verrucomicrobiota bacterium]